MQNLNELAKLAHEISSLKGFWDQPRNTGEIFMLMVSELAEALEADRKGRRASLEGYELYKRDSGFDVDVFKAEIKDTFEDEIADTVIRILDFCFGKGIDVSFDRFDDLDNEADTKNVGQYLLSITGSLFYASVSAVAIEFNDNKEDRDNLTLEIHEALAKLFGVAESRDFDLIRHIELKMQYNSTRERMHGKKY